MKKENQDKIVDRLHRVDGTCIEFLEKRKYRSDNKSGFRGVFQMPNGRYRVSIGFRGKGFIWVLIRIMIQLYTSDWMQKNESMENI